MNRGPAAWLRLTVALLGVILAVVGVGALLWKFDVGPIRDWLGRTDPSAGARFAGTDWWPAVLVAVALIAALWGFRLLAAVVRPGKVDGLRLAGSGTGGELTIAPKLVADAVRADLAAKPIFHDVDAKATDDRGRKIIRVTVTAEPTHSYAEIAASLGDTVENIREALDGSDIHVQSLVHLEKRSS